MGRTYKLNRKAPARWANLSLRPSCYEATVLTNYESLKHKTSAYIKGWTSVLSTHNRPSIHPFSALIHAPGPEQNSSGLPLPSQLQMSWMRKDLGPGSFQ